MRLLHALRRHPIRVASTMCVLAAVALAAADPGWTSRQIALSFNPQPAHYSEIFFTNLPALPVHRRPGAESVVPFAIVNREGRTLAYSYTISVAGAGVHLPVQQGQVVLKDNQKASLIASFAVSLPRTAYTVTIRINKPADFIEFHGRTT